MKKHNLIIAMGLGFCLTLPAFADSIGGVQITRLISFTSWKFADELQLIQKKLPLKE